jgi:hypothetical protein
MILRDAMMFSPMMVLSATARTWTGNHRCAAAPSPGNKLT